LIGCNKGARGGGEPLLRHWSFAAIDDYHAH
jgi:hypothetical protein